MTVGWHYTKLPLFDDKVGGSGVEWVCERGVVGFGGGGRDSLDGMVCVFACSVLGAECFGGVFIRRVYVTSQGLGHIMPQAAAASAGCGTPAGC